MWQAKPLSTLIIYMCQYLQTTNGPLKWNYMKLNQQKMKNKYITIYPIIESQDLNSHSYLMYFTTHLMVPHLHLYPKLQEERPLVKLILPWFSRGFGEWGPSEMARPSRNLNGQTAAYYSMGCLTTHTKADIKMIVPSLGPSFQ